MSWSGCVLSAPSRCWNVPLLRCVAAQAGGWRFRPLPSRVRLFLASFVLFFSPAHSSLQSQASSLKKSQIFLISGNMDYLCVSFIIFLSSLELDFFCKPTESRRWIPGDSWPLTQRGVVPLRGPCRPGTWPPASRAAFWCRWRSRHPSGSLLGFRLLLPAAWHFHFTLKNFMVWQHLTSSVFSSISSSFFLRICHTCFLCRWPLIAACCPHLGLCLPSALALLSPLVKGPYLPAFSGAPAHVALCYRNPDWPRLYVEFRT